MEGDIRDDLHGADGAMAVNEKAHSAIAQDSRMDQRRDYKIAWSGSPVE
jgi:hypothetical protein